MSLERDLIYEHDLHGNRMISINQRIGRNIRPAAVVKQRMYCPRCANKFESGTSYCRTCGLSLDQVSAIVSGEKESQPLVKSGPNRDLMRYGIGTFILGLVV